MNLSKEKMLIQLKLAAYDKNNEKLNLCQCNSQWSDIIQMNDWSQLKSISLGKCDIQDNSIHILADLDWPELTYINLSDNKITTKGAEILAQNKWPKLTTLIIYRNDIRNEGFISIVRILENRSIFLGLSGCGINWKGMEMMTNIDISNVRQLFLSYYDDILGKNIIGSIGIKWLTKSNLINLEQLRICDCQIGSEGLKHITKSKWPNLTKLQSDIYLNFSQQIALYTNSWEKIILLDVGELESISCFNYLLFHSSSLKISIYSFQMFNYDLFNRILDILRRKNFLMED